MSTEDKPQISCDDIGLLLKEMRAIDDKIIYQLNLATPTASFRKEEDPTENCKELFSHLEKTYKDRSTLITNCLDEFRSNVRGLAEKFSTNKDDYILHRKLRSEQSKVRELQSELTIEEIIRQRSLKAFEEKCKLFFKPSVK
ncbi:Coiled-coil domain-containing protein 58 [Armadillidium nasatum]|uniref:Protein MIX23 n=1 Tax=Armadillidium nasatum TaxID=96803 RepID=A0A5N5SRW6_9CRUS|nr:Coiled-coil domain-containing protein 58 [Armadillidium nasatum]